MAGTLMLINPSKRRAKRAAPKKRARARRRNPVAALANPRRRARRTSAVRRRRNPMALRSVRRSVRRRARNPISVKGFGSLAVGMVKEAVIGGVGSVAVDAVMGQVKPMLPLSMQSGMAYTAVKALGTVALGMVARKMMGSAGMTAAQGALTVQMAGLVRQYAPASLTMGYLSPAAIMQGGTSMKPVPTSMGRVGGMGRLRAVRANTINTGFMNSGLLSGMGSIGEMQGVYR